LLAALAAACGRDLPTTAAPTAGDGRYLTIVSGDTGEPVAAAQVSVAGRTLTSDAEGRVALPSEAGGSVDVQAAGYLSRQTRLGSERITLWPIAPGRGPDYVRAIVYRSSAAGGVGGLGAEQALQRVEAARVVVSPSRAIVRDVEAMAALRQAVAQINDATEGRVEFSLGGSPAGAAVFSVEVDTGLPWIAATYKRLEGATIAGGRIVLGSLANARSSRFLAHELGHALGLQHSAAPADLMFFEAREGGAVSFSGAERLTIRLLLQRHAGNHYPDNDRDAAVPTAAAYDVAVE
jgi:hypothetical protein